MPAPTYAERLEDPRWKAKSLEIIRKNFGICFHCGNVPAFPEVHHRWYERGKEPWEYPDCCYAVYCGECHQHAQVLMLQMQQATGVLSLAMQELLIAFVNRYSCWHLQDVLSITDPEIARRAARDCFLQAAKIGDKK